MKHERPCLVASGSDWLQEVLRRLLVWVVVLSSGTLMAYAGNLDISQTKVITGTVTEKETGDPLIGVNVSVKGTSKGTITNLNGQYSVDVNSDKDILVFSFIGKATQEKAVKGLSQIDVVMADDATMLGEVVIQTGYMTQRKADLTGSVAMANTSDLAQNPSTNALKSLQGKLPGVFITTDGSPGGNASIQIRGLTSLNAQPNPLIVLDGLAGDYNLRDINPANIESIQLLNRDSHFHLNS